jgi:glycosyl transferase family 2
MSEDVEYRMGNSRVKRLQVCLHDQTVEVRCPPSVAEDIAFLYRDSLVTRDAQGSCILIEEAPDGCFSLATDDCPPVRDLTRGDLPTFVMDAVVRCLVKDLTTAVALHAGAVIHNGMAVLIAGPTGAGKSSLIAWLIGNGFNYLSDEVVILLEQSAILGLSRALVLKPGSAEEVLALPAYRAAPSVPAGEHIMVRPRSVLPRAAKSCCCALIVFPQFESGAGLRIESITPAHAAFRLVGTNLNARNLADGGFRAITGFARQAPAVTLRYGSFDQFDGTVDVLMRFLLDGSLDAAARPRFLSLFAPGATVEAPSTAAVPAPPKAHAIPAPTPRGTRRRLTVGMATYDDYDGVYFSLQALRLYHPEVLAETNFLVVDNHPDGPCAEALKALEESTPHYRYVPFNAHSGTAVRDCIFSEADGEFVLCMDCHVFIVPGALKRLMDVFAAQPETRDLLQGPLVHDDLATIATHFRPEWRQGMYGCWDTDERGKDLDGAPFDIPMQGLGVFSCRRSVWPGFNPRFRGFGGEEGYIHEKFRRHGGRTLCLPFLRWMHRFRRPAGVPYTNRWEDRVRNYMIGFRELGLPVTELESHYRELLGDAAEAILRHVRQELDAV